MKSGVRLLFINYIFLFLQFVRMILFIPRGTCRFHPTCSEYIKESFLLLPIHLSLYYSMKRIFSCHPFSKGGFDPLPNHIKEHF